jgi:hypothetical protein
VLDNGEGRAPNERPGLTPTTTATNGPAMLPHDSDPTAVGELVSAWVGAKLDEVDGLVDEARTKAAAIPDQCHLWLLLGETLVRLHCVELELAELRKGARR